MSDKINKPRVVLVTAPIEAEQLARLQALSADLQIERWPARSAGGIPDDLWWEVEVLYTSFATPLPPPERAPGLRWVQLYSAGPDPVLDQPLFRAPVTFTTASGVHAVNMAEYVFTVVLAWFHRLPRILEWQQRGRWPSNSERSSLFVPEELRGKTIGIAGYGSIGRHVARLADAFGMRVLATQRGTDHRDRGFQSPGVGDPEGILPARFFTPDQLPAMLSECDIVIIAMPLTRETRGLFGDAALGAMKPMAFLVNVARGDICDEAALVRTLEEGRIAGAALDVFHQEPLPPTSPLWHLPNAFISPHISGLTPHYEARASAIFEENLRRYLVGASLYNVVDKGRGY